MPSPLPPNRATAPVAATPTSPVGGWSDEPIKFLDPHALIAASRPRPNRLTGLPLLVIVGLSLIVFSAPSDSPLGKAIGSVGPILFLGMLIGLNIAARRGASQMAIESQAVTALDELIQLRRWQEAADLAMRLFSQPMRSPERRMHALTGLAQILTRYHRFEEARVVHDYVLNRSERDDSTDESIAAAKASGVEPLPDPSTAHAIRVARAMGLLREDRLVDADRAMADLRREVNQARDEVRRQSGAEAAAKVRSAGLVLLDLYRDVKTRHYEEAIANFEASASALREQLGGRIADAWLLYAACLHGLGRTDEARAAYENATVLIPPIELHRRYPETAELAKAYEAYRWPEG